MKVLGHSSYYHPVKICPLCGCVFEFEQSEVTKFVKCPECGLIMNVEESDR